MLPRLLLVKFRGSERVQPQEMAAGLEVKGKIDLMDMSAFLLLKRDLSCYVRRAWRAAGRMRKAMVPGHHGRGAQAQA